MYILIIGVFVYPSINMKSKFSPTFQAFLYFGPTKKLLRIQFYIAIFALPNVRFFSKLYKKLSFHFQYVALQSLVTILLLQFEKGRKTKQYCYFEEKAKQVLLFNIFIWLNFCVYIRSTESTEIMLAETFAHIYRMSLELRFFITFGTLVLQY